ncbi:monocarboxylate transporter 13-like [Liolophura sinensis]|uniref:monocarboxylate transporter 13-like n=1 Tax=Liolophura sinensis TaxID=3198878 RepID=UPI003158B013
MEGGMARENDRDVKPKYHRTKVVRQGLVLLAAFFCQMISLGFAFSLGVFYVEFVASFPVGRGAVSWATSLCSGLLFGAGLFVGWCIQRAGPRMCTMLGSLIATAGVLSSSFVSNLELLYVTFGGLSGIGLCLVQMSSAVAIDRHFQQGTAAAMSIAAVGAGIGSLSFPVLLRFLIDYYNWRGALMVFSGVILNALPLGILFVPVKPKVKEELKNNDAIQLDESQIIAADEEVTTTGAEKQVESGPMNKAKNKFCASSMFRNILYDLYLAITPVISTGYSFPFVALVDLALLRGIDKNRGTWLVTYISISTTITTFVIGLLLRYFHKRSLRFFDVSLLIMGTVLFVFPTLKSYASLVCGSVAYGIAMGGLTATYAVIVVDMIGSRQYATGFGFVCTGYGVGYLLGTPVAGWINDLTGSYDTSFYIAGSLCLGPAIPFIVTQLVLHYRKSKKHSLKVKSYKTETNVPQSP